LDLLVSCGEGKRLSVETAEAYVDQS